MKRLIFRYLAVIVAMLLGISCSVTRNLADDEYMISKVKVEADRSAPRDERITMENEKLGSYI
jgi:hypothetical protein